MFGYLKKESAKARATFDVLDIGPHVLTTPNRTIAVQRIATITVGPDPTPRPRLAYAIAAIVLAVATLAAASAPEGLGQGPMGWAILLGISALVAMAAAVLPGDRRQYLLVTTTDGLITRFHAPDESILEEVRQILTAKLNGDERDLTCTVNFAKATIEAWQPGAGHNAETVQTLPARTSPTQSLNGTRESTHGTSAQVDATTGGRGAGQRPSTAITVAQNTNFDRYANGATHGANGYDAAPANGHASNTANGASVASAMDFNDTLPSIVEMQRFYLRDPNAAHVERRLSELELLMRSGAQTYGQRTRIIELSRDLAHYLQNYPPAVRLFHQIASQASRGT